MGSVFRCAMIKVHLMGWLSNFFKCSDSDHNVLDGHQSASLNSRTETEGTDRAIALSLKGKYTVGREPKLDDDEQPAKAHGESFNVGSHPEPWSRNDSGNGYGYGSGYGHDNLYEPINYPYSTSFRICAGCNTGIGHGIVVGCMNFVWHPQCFRCHGCNQPISDTAFMVSGRGCLYHVACFEFHHPKCDVCQHFIPRNAAGLIENPFWSQKYCPRHEHDGSFKCCSCKRMESQNVKFSLLDDGRKLCLECERSAVISTSECQPLLDEIHEFFKRLNMELAQHISLVLVKRHVLMKLNQPKGGERHGHIQGLCLFEERTVTTFDDQIPGTSTEPYMLRRHYEVTIYILYGLPRLLTGLILAHEMMHAWFGLNGYPKLRDEVEEGICEVISYMWLESQIVSMSDESNASTSYSASTPFEKKLCMFFIRQIATNADVVYGNGFRAAHKSVIEFGLPKTLDHIRKTGNLPS